MRQNYIELQRTARAWLFDFVERTTGDKWFSPLESRRLEEFIDAAWSGGMDEMVNAIANQAARGMSVKRTSERDSA